MNLNAVLFFHRFIWVIRHGRYRGNIASGRKTESLISIDMNFLPLRVLCFLPREVSTVVSVALILGKRIDPQSNPFC